MEGGSAYAVNTETRDLELVYSRGSSKQFKWMLSSIGVDMESMRLITQGRLIHGSSNDARRMLTSFLPDGKASQIIVIPVLNEGSLVACFCMASRTSMTLPGSVVFLLEAIAAQVTTGLARIWAQRAMRNSVEKYWALVDGAPDGILLGDMEGNILETNKRAREMFGYEESEYLGRNFFELLRPVALQKAKAAFERIKRSELTAPAVMYLKRKDGRLAPVELTASVVELAERKFVQGIFRDITGRKEAERALRQSEEKYRTLMEHAGDAIIHASVDGEILESNRKTEELLGYAVRELAGVNYSRLHPGHESREIFGKGKRGSAQGTLEDALAVRRDGSLIPIDMSWSEIKVRGASVIQVIMHDVSRRKKAEDGLRESESRYRAIFENTGTAMVIFEKEMTISFVNTEFERMSGCRRTEIEGRRKWSDFIQDHGQKSETSRLRCVASSKDNLSPAVKPTSAGAQNFRAVVVSRTGSRKPVLVCIAALPGSGRSIASLIDVSQLVYAEQVLKQSEERYRALVQQSSEAIFIVDPKTKKIMEVNKPFSNMLGYEDDDIQSLFLYDLIMESKSFIDTSVSKTMQNGQYFMGERNFRGKNGLVVDVDIAASSINYGNSTFIMMSFRDITEKKQMEAALRQAQKMEAIGTLAGGIAHDFNNMLQVIAGCAYQLNEKLKERKDDPLASLTEQALSSCEKASQLTKSILTFSRKQPIDPQPIDVNSVISSIERLLKRIVGEEIEFHMEYSADRLLVMADKVQIEQVLINIATNARDAMPKGGVMRIGATIEEIGEPFVRSRGYGIPGAYACISVSDTGSGMDEETKRRIFEPFYTTKEMGKGTGLGMSVVYGIVKQHKGYIDVESQPGMGTTIKVYFPLTAITQNDTPAAPEGGPVVGGTETILLAEDEREVRTFLTGILEEAGYSIIEAENGEDAVEKYAASKKDIHLALIDVVMPRKDGKQAYDEMRKIRRNVKVIFMSGYSEDTVHSRGILKTGVALLSKPVPPVLLLSKIRETLDS